MNNNNFNQEPVLTEPGVKYFLDQTLKQCHIIKNNFHNTVVNVGLLIAFLLILGLILLYKYKGRLSDVEKEKKNKTNPKTKKERDVFEQKRLNH